MTLIDAIGTVHVAVAPGEQPRIVSLVPSITELLCDLGLAPWLVGRTGFCIHPADVVAAIPKVGGTKAVNIDKIRRLAPTHLVVNIDENEKPTVEELARFIPHIIVTHPLAPQDNPGLYRLLGGIFGAASRAEALCAAFERSLAALQALPPRPAQRVLYCIWKDPWMTVSADTYIARMLALIGWTCWQAPSPERYPRFEWSDALAREIDMVLLSTEPYRFTEEHVDALERQVGSPVLLVDGEMLSWYGSRAIQGLAYLQNLALEAR
ncbi:ABC-type Fe3+-hydroxamate transport system, substrate-binding protein [Noviherbaspirillum humi]|uniref:ABC-type Fe3+-hydroxamate transport system, substrate-binding protein n=1 Tax=Noviherbaspirillum humi TaxID=1688639 RepID=A0A239BUY6_9BURK|nr:helical backbone metal receptor [Noviherbaspirillum humi]SNS11479.1 ABC-type Fe3+-hydroxamate transport system, substrate-binding protein [Noviherbaspirillum humi]